MAGGNPVPEAVNANGRGFRRRARPRSLSCSPATATSSTCAGRVQYRVKDPVAFAFNVAEPDALVRGASLAALRGRGRPQRHRCDLHLGPQRVEQQVAHAIQETSGPRPAPASRSCPSICCTSIRRRRCTTRSATSRARRRTSCARSIAPTSSRWRRSTRPRARRPPMIEQALAFKEQQILHAQGDAASFLLRLGAYRQAPELTSSACRSRRSKRRCRGCRSSSRPAPARSRTSTCGCCSRSGEQTQVSGTHDRPPIMQDSRMPLAAAHGAGAARPCCCSGRWSPACSPSTSPSTGWSCASAGSCEWSNEPGLHRQGCRSTACCGSTGA